MQKQTTIRAPEAVDVLFFAGAALVSLGVGLLAGLAAGLISAGVFSLAAAWLSDRPDREDGELRK